MNNHERIFFEILQQHRKYNTYQLFYDFCNCATYAINYPVEKREDREKRFQEIIMKYPNPNEIMNLFAKLLSTLILAMEENPFRDILGNVYMNLKIADQQSLGQCFTPNSISYLCSGLTLNDVEDIIKKDGFLSLNDCCVGSGSMILAAAKTLKEKGINPQTKLVAVCNDIDQLCVWMAYIQLSLYGIPAKVSSGDSLANEFTDSYYTPMWMLFIRKGGVPN